MKGDFYARIVEKDGVLSKQLLSDHLYNVADRAAGYGADFDSGDWAYLIGLWHDLGKYQPGFQDKLKNENFNVEHSGVGAALAFDRYKELALPIAYSIAGHHTGLANRIESGADLPLPLMERIRQNQSLVSQIINLIPEAIISRSIPDLPEYVRRQVGNQESARRIELWTRFLFSVLVDSDRLDAECFDDPTKQELRAGYVELPKLGERLDSYIRRKIDDIPVNRVNSPVNRLRQLVLEECKNAAEQRPGIFSLNVPTGGGKTLSAMSFAVKHVWVRGLKHQESKRVKRRIVSRTLYGCVD